MDHILTPYIRTNSKWIKDLNVRSETIKLLEENIGSNFFDTAAKTFLHTSPQERESKAKINYRDNTKTKKFYTAK